MKRLARLLQTHQITSVQLTEIYLERLRRYSPSYNARSRYWKTAP
ncbi:MAG: hypothetical protein U0521_11185 [Anaerolineae bacterium]